MVGTFCKVKEDKIKEKYGSKGKYCSNGARSITFPFARSGSEAQVPGRWDETQGDGCICPERRFAGSAKGEIFVE